jgi:hypothetical protein
MTNVIQLKHVKQAATETHDGPTTVLQMTETEHNAYISALRERRFAIQRRFDALQAEKLQFQQLSVQLKIDKKAVAIKTQMERVDIAVDKLEKLLNDMRALVLQYGD